MTVIITKDFLSLHPIVISVKYFSNMNTLDKILLNGKPFRHLKQLARITMKGILKCVKKAKLLSYIKPW